jgi:hypothetical protein
MAEPARRPTEETARAPYPGAAPGARCSVLLCLTLAAAGARADPQVVVFEVRASA